MNFDGRRDNTDTWMPKIPQFVDELVRLQTFEQRWPRDLQQLPRDLAKAGFFYAGMQDCTKCYHCGGGLRNWEPSDNIWVEHARWFPKCAFLRLQMGQHFIDCVTELSKTSDQISINDVLDKMNNAFKANL